MSSWLRTAVSKAVEAGGRSNLTRAVKEYADAVAHHAGQAVAGGAKILQERMGPHNYRSLKQTVKRLEEVAVSCHGAERVQMLKRWLLALKQIQSKPGGSANGSPSENAPTLEEPNTTPAKVPPVLFCDDDNGGELLTFLDVFLYSQALEGISLSMIIEPPNEEEVSLLLEIFSLCLTGGKEVHHAIMSSIQDLGKVFSEYEDEVLVKREELLQFAQGAISGLKLNYDIIRINNETSKLCHKIDEMEALQVSSADKRNHEVAEKTAFAMSEAFKEALNEVRLCSRLEDLILKKNSISNGDTSEIHSQKVEKLRILADSLANSSSKAEKRILDHRCQKEEAVNFRVVKESEVNATEKELVAEISGLEKKRDELEAELKKVNISLNAALVRLRMTKEEKDQFDEANDQIVQHLQNKENELSKSIASCKIEAKVVHTWINFLEDAWVLQYSYNEIKEKQTMDELERCKNYFVKLIKHHLSTFKEVLIQSIIQIQKNVDKIKEFDESLMTKNDGDHKVVKDSNARKYVEESYLESEKKIVTAFSAVDRMKQLFYAEKGKEFRREDADVSNLLLEINQLQKEFESIERPTLQIEIPKEKSGSEERQQVAPSSSVMVPDSPKHSKSVGNSPPISPVLRAQLDSELAKLELEFGNASKEYSADEISGWEFDELEEELRLETK